MQFLKTANCNTTSDLTIIGGKGMSENFTVIDTIRFIAMCSIVWGHCNLGSETTAYHNGLDVALQSAVLQLGKIGTIMFFLISGFLIAPKLESYTPFGFLRLRFKSTILPWLVFVVIFVLLNLVNSVALKTAMHNGNIKQVLLINAEVFKDSIFYFAYWFIIVFIISALILVIFRKHVHTVWIGCILGTLTLFYSVNLHYAWISVYHTKAFLGYAFFMWLGLQVNLRYRIFNRLLNNVGWPVFIICFVVSFIAACYEGFYLSQAGCADPYASIRLSNIINSVIAFAFLFKLGKIDRVNNLEPRKLVFGIYLLHNILIYEMISFYTRYFNNRYVVHSALTLLVVEIVAFLLIFSTSIVLVNALNGKYSAAFYRASSNARKGMEQLARQTIYILGPVKYTGLISMQNVYRVSRFALLIILPCFYILLTFF